MTRTPPRGWLKDTAAARAPYQRPTPCHVVLKRLFKMNPNKPVALPISDFTPRRIHKSLERLRKEGMVLRPANSGIRWCYIYDPAELCTAH